MKILEFEMYIIFLKSIKEKTDEELKPFIEEREKTFEKFYETLFDNLVTMNNVCQNRDEEINECFDILNSLWDKNAKYWEDK